MARTLKAKLLASMRHVLAKIVLAAAVLAAAVLVAAEEIPAVVVVVVMAAEEETASNKSVNSTIAKYRKPGFETLESGLFL